MVPSWPLASTSTMVDVARPVVAPLIPAMYVAVWQGSEQLSTVLLPPMRITFDSPATPWLPISMLLLSLVVKFWQASYPSRMFVLPPEKFQPASNPTPVLLEPVMW